jgi:tRNA threonylcarbamoyladenosine biosynthesis protein TsaE
MGGDRHQSTINIYTELQFGPGFMLQPGRDVSLPPMEIRFTLEGIQEAASQFWKVAGNAKVFAFHGQMGAGKTTFIHALCDVRGVTSTVGSPTFSIINEYVWPGGTIFHIDLYRLNDAEEAIRAGVEDCLYSGNTCLVEWPERAAPLFPDDTLSVHIQALDPQTRLLRIDEN